MLVYNDHAHTSRTHTHRATLKRGLLAVCLEGTVAPEEKLANGISMFLKIEDEAMNQGM